MGNVIGQKKDEKLTNVKDVTEQETTGCESRWQGKVGSGNTKGSMGK